MAASTTLTPIERQERARKAAAESHSLDAIIRRLQRRSAELTQDQIDALREITE
jgi:hypothetical protein